ncbi:MAG: 30S ribosome-binding factor RbfA [Gemmatimonadota bacterium]
MSNYRRVDRVNQLLREELSRLIRREMKDPRVSGATVTGVDTSPDLRHAKVHVRTLREEPSAEDAVEGLRSAEGFLRKKLGKELRIRRVPEFRFEVDESLERVRRIESLLDQVHEEDGPPETDAGEGE